MIVKITVEHPEGVNCVVSVDADIYDKGSGTHLELYSCETPDGADYELTIGERQEVIDAISERRFDEYNERGDRAYDNWKEFRGSEERERAL